MNNYSIGLEIDEEELKQLMDEITEAQKRIIDCCYKLERLGAVTIRRKEAASDN